jgi:putative MATE family efflux protein
MTGKDEAELVGTDRPEASRARFVEGSTMRHVVVMTATGSVGLMAVFLVDFANLFYIAQLGQQHLAAAIGYAGTILFFNVSICIGITIAATALVSRYIGQGDRERARHMAGSALAFMVLATIIVAGLIIAFVEPALTLLGAGGETRAIARGFLLIVLPSMPIMGFGMCLSGLLRAQGDAKRAMFVTLGAGFAAAVLDPLFIFGFDLGVTGAAIATVCSRIIMVLIGLHGAIRIHDLVGMPSIGGMLDDSRALASIALPAVLTNIATPVGNAYITGAIAPYGDDAVAGWSVIGRIIPVAFGAIFALSGAIGPILGQNFGARRFDRVRQAMRDALVLMIVYCLVVWVILFSLQGYVISIFDATQDAAELISFFCTVAAFGFLFNGGLFVANAAFNNLGFPTLSTLFNWGKATVGTIPFVWAGSVWMGATGVLLGQAVGALIFGLASIIVCFRVLENLDTKDPDQRKPPLWRSGASAFSSAKSATLHN